MLKHWIIFYRPQRSPLWYWYSTEDAIIADFALQTFTCFLRKLCQICHWCVSIIMFTDFLFWAVVSYGHAFTCLTKVLSKMPKPLIRGFLLTAYIDGFILFHLVHLMTQNISDCIALSEVWLANSELDKMWKDLVMVWCEASGICLDRVHSWKSSIRVVSLSWDLNIVHTKREAGMLDTQTWHFWLTVQDDCQQIWMFILSPEGLPLGAVWSFNRQIWQCRPIKYTSLLSKTENVPQWEFKLNGVPATAYTLHFTGSES